MISSTFLAQVCIFFFVKERNRKRIDFNYSETELAQLCIKSVSLHDYTKKEIKIFLGQQTGLVHSLVLPRRLPYSS